MSNDDVTSSPILTNRSVEGSWSYEWTANGATARLIQHYDIAEIDGPDGKVIAPKVADTPQLWMLRPDDEWGLVGPVVAPSRFGTFTDHDGFRRWVVRFVEMTTL